MSTKISLSEYHKELAEKYLLSMGKENACTVQNGKTEGKNEGKKKGLSLNTENHAAVRTTSVQNSCFGKLKFQIYHDSNDENVRSRSRVRKDVCRKEIRARQDNIELEKTIVATTEVAEAKIAPYSRIFTRRARSTSNSRNKIPLDKPIQVESNSKLFQNRRSYSETRRISLQRAQSVIDVKKARHLTDDVKKRTFASMQIWSEKMRKSHTGTVPKNITANVNNNNVYAKTKLRKRSDIRSMDLQSEMPQYQINNLNENIEQKAEDDPLKTVLKHVSNKITDFLQNCSYLTVQADTGVSSTSKETQDNNRAIVNKPINRDYSLNINCSIASVTPLEGSLLQPLTPTKVRYVKCVTKEKALIKEDELDDYYTLYEVTCNIVRDYLQDVPDTERDREKNAPRLTSRFLHENINAEQRRIIVKYIIRLGAHYQYPSHVIYQTVKLFNVAIDRIVVKVNDVQLLALACLWIILKREAPNKIPTATAILQLAKDLYTNQEKYLLMFEKKIFSVLKFNTRFADPFSLLSYYILNVNRDIQSNIIKPNNIVRLFFCGSYMIDISMLDESLCDIPTYVIAIAATELTLCLEYSSDVNMDGDWFRVWRSKQSLTEWEEQVMNSTKQIMIRDALKHDRTGSNVVYKKYMHSKYGGVTNFLYDKLKKIAV
ncbi:uncharacterized protein LOC105833023 isoform X1 [Monomorium pharaonis]|uniref:uncharacterized protein LOC105833023 isoform X1 n=1 Tax=Monomorium pharaonis TaxID=307658 RepID=UPI00063F790B|nr:uncharacterized protein LOC105833023 isoform X1 [Monomorium pharaonis]